MAGSGERVKEWEDFDWVAWRLTADDPEGRVQTSFEASGQRPDLAERTRQPMTELAAQLGCVYEDCCDDDTYSDDVPYYAWWVRLPQAEHARRTEAGIPVAVDQLHQYLRAQLPDQLPWEIAPDRERTVDHAASTAMREAYADVITPFEQALMPLRIDGAEDLEPRAKVWTWEKQLLVGTFDLWLCNDPDQAHTWLVVTVGLWTEQQLFDDVPAARVGHFDFTPHHPLLFLPRPPGPVTFTARVTGGAFPHRRKSRSAAASAIGVAHQWTANDPAVLAARVRRDLTTLLPHLPGPR